MPQVPSRLSAALSGRYRIERELGAGGMATVYLAFDEKHDRKVAIKVLKPELAAVLGAERFVVEIKTTAAMSHPHILPLFDSGTADGFLFYVMPYLEGETIREKLNRETQFGIDEAVKITAEVAEALDYAHHHGVIHRDIKPENILLHAGRPMVMDFGIALAVSAAAGGRMTETGLSLGTPHYMSPEQATADKQITARSDVYSLASVLYEMLTGNPPHTGSSAQQIIMKIIAEPVQSATALRRSVPPNVAAALAKALEKLPADRFESAKAFADALGNPNFTTAAARAGSTGRSAAVTSWLRNPLSWGVIVAAAVATGVAWNAPRTMPAAPTVREVLSVPDVRVTHVDLSHDGRRVVYSGLNEIHVRELNQTSIRRLTTGTRARLSPDGSMVAFVRQPSRALYLVPFEGGAETLRAESVPGGEWGDDGKIYSRIGRALVRFTATPGPIDTLAQFDSAATAGLDPQAVLPGSRALLATRAVAGDLLRRELVFVDLSAGEIRPLGLAAAAARYLDGGYLLLLEGPSLASTRLSVVRFDPRRGRLLGAPVHFVAAADQLEASGGVLVYGNELARRIGLSALIDRSGTTRAVPQADSVSLAFGRVSPSGAHIAYAVANESSQPRLGLDPSDVWFTAATGGPAQRRTFGGSVERRVIGWGAGGTHIVFTEQSADSLAVMSVPADGSAQPTQIFLSAKLASQPMRPASVGLSADGRMLAWSSANNLIQSVSLGDSTVKTTRVEQRQPFAIQPSPTGGWVAYTSNLGSGPDVYIQSLAGAGGTIQVSDGRGYTGEGGVSPVWSRSGQSLFYTTTKGDVEEATLDLAARRVVQRRRLFRGASPTDVFPRDSLFLGRRDNYFSPRTTLVLIVNPQPELERVLAKRP